MILKLNYRYLQSYLTFYYERLPKVNVKDKEKRGLDMDETKRKLKSIAEENLVLDNKRRALI